MKLKTLCAALACTAILPLIPMGVHAELANDSMIGAGLRSRPAYDGSDSQKTELVPVVRYLGPHLFVRSTQGVLEGGVRTELAPGLHAGAQLAYEPGRRDSDFLSARGMPDIGRGASLGLQMEWDHKLGPVPFTLLARARKATDSSLGMQADLRASAGVFQAGGFAAGVFAQAVWANAKSAAAYYGVTPAQSIATGLRPYQPGSGWLNKSVGLLGSYDIGTKWVVVGSLERRRLAGDARRSPLAERSSNTYATAGLAYRF